MKRTLILAFAALVAAAGAAAQDFDKMETLHDDRKLAEEYAILSPLHKQGDPQAAIVYRMIRCIQEMAVQMPGSDKNAKLAKFDEAINFGKPLLDTAKGSVRDRAKVLYWYGVALGQKGTTMGVLNALFMTGEIKSMCDRAIAMDPTFADPYYLKAKLDDAIPPVAGGDKNRMGQLYAKALELDPINIWYLTDFAIALKGRNKNAAFNKDGAKGVPAGKADAEYAVELAKRARAAIAALPKPTLDQKEKIQDMEKVGL